MISALQVRCTVHGFVIIIKCFSETNDCCNRKDQLECFYENMISINGGLLTSAALKPFCPGTNTCFVKFVVDNFNSEVEIQE